MKPEEIYAALVAKNEGDPEKLSAYLDEETNTLWILTGERVMTALWSPDHMLKYMSEKEINNFIMNTIK